MTLRFGLLSRIVLALALVAAVPLALLTVQLVRLNSTAMADQVLQTHSVAARATAERAAAFVSGLRTAAESVAGNPGMRDVTRSAAMQDLLRGFVAAQPEVIGVAVTDPEGAEVLRAQRRQHAAVLSRFVDAVPTDDPALVEEGGRRWLGLDVALPEGAGWLRVAADAEALLRILHPEDLGEGAELAIVDRDGAVIAGDGAAHEYPAELVEAARHGRLGGSGRYQGRFGAVLGAFAPVRGAQWSVLSMQPAVVAEGVARRMRRQASLAVGVAAALAVALTVGAYRTLVQPLRDLVAGQRRLAGLPAKGAKGGSEINDLRESMATLERHLADREDLGRVFLGRYQVMEVAGAGAMGTVFRGWDPKLERWVALKTIRLGKGTVASERQSMVSSLLREAVVVARFSHPHIVAVYDVEDIADAAFVAMEYVDGVSLQRHLEHQGRLAIGEVAVLGAAVASALAAAHGHHVVHHDIKPGNVLLGFAGAIKVVDFGIARLITTMARETDHIFGTPGYLPPEALRGEGFDERGDLFALGVVMFQAATGTLPFRGRSMQEYLRLVVEADGPDPRSRRPDIPEDLADLIRAMLRADPERRATSAEVVARRLGRLADEAGWTWTPPVDAVVEAAEAGHDTHSQLVDTHTLRGRDPGASR